MSVTDLKLGIKSSSTCQLAFDNVKIPKENVVGEVGKGYKVCLSAGSEKSVLTADCN
jgi:short/branched chain acyl-CoA dehydrogenase